MSNPADAPMAFLNMARKYQKAASRLLDSVATEPMEGNQVPLADPIYFLYFQTVELALKAFLRFHGKAVPKGQAGHDIVKLLSRCAVLGLRHADALGLQNVINLLASGNVDQGFRYFTIKSSSIPELSWTREVVDLLIQSIREDVEANQAPPGASVAVKIQMILGKPRERSAGG
jgi:hypothetical protein